MKQRQMKKVTSKIKDKEDQIYMYNVSQRNKENLN